MMTRIFIFGSSTCYGAWDEQGGWADRLKRYLHKNYVNSNSDKKIVYNLGISGNTTRDVIKRFDSEIKPRAKENNIIIFAIGLNDSQLVNNKPRNSIREFKKNVKELINKARKYTEKIVFIGFASVDEKLTTPVSWNKTKSYTNERIIMFEKALIEVCNKERVEAIPLFKKLEKQGFVNLLLDGLHANTNGHEKLFNIIKEYLVERNVL